MIGKLKSEDGYTITEVLVVLAIVGLLAGMALPMMSTSIQKARETTLRTNLSTLRTVIDEYYADHLTYPETLEALVEEGYLRTLPKDTIERIEEDWVIEHAEKENGIINISSRSTDEALDGTIYADW